LADLAAAVSEVVIQHSREFPDKVTMVELLIKMDQVAEVEVGQDPLADLMDHLLNFA
jgi:hypothetical protein